MKRIPVEDGSSVAYDFASFNLGIAPDLSGIAGADSHAIPIKPIAGFLQRFEALAAHVREPDGPRRIGIIGGGAGGFEIAIAVAGRLRREARFPERLTFELFSSGPLLATLPASARRRALRALSVAGITVHQSARIFEIETGFVRDASGATYTIDAVLISTQARPASWLARTGLTLCPDGGIAVQPDLRSINRDHVFAVGDCATMADCPRPRAGVFAVRQGPALAANLRRAVRGEMLAPHHPQSRYLMLLRSGEGRAIGTRAGWPTVEGRWVWRWKDAIDRRFMALFQI